MKAVTKSLSGLVLGFILCLFILPLFFAASAGVAHADTGAVAAPVSAISVLLALLPDWLHALSLLVTACASIAALTPTPKDDGVLLVLRKVIDFLALNFGNATNASRVEADKSLR